MNEAACNLAFQKTRGQSDCRYWHSLRFGRISASNLYPAAQFKIAGGGVLKELIFGASTLHLRRAMQRGLQLENDVLYIVKQKFQIKIRTVGIKLSPEYPEFGASPDGLTEDSVIEIKCPLTMKTFTKYIRQNDVVGPKFMAQMQLQMKLCKKEKAIYCVAHPDFETSKKVKIVSVDYDSKLADSLIQKARVYWEKHIFPVLLDASRL